MRWRRSTRPGAVWQSRMRSRTTTAQARLERNAANIPGEVELFEHLDEPGRRIELPAIHAVDGGPWPTVMAVVIALTHGEQANEPVVPTPVVGGIRARTPGVTDRVHAPRDVVNEEHTHEPAPDQALPSPDEERDDKTERRPDEEGPVNKGDSLIFEQRRAVERRIGLFAAEQPTQMGMPEPFCRTMRIAL